MQLVLTPAPSPAIPPQGFLSKWEDTAGGPGRGHGAARDELGGKGHFVLAAVFCFDAHVTAAEWHVLCPG